MKKIEAGDLVYVDNEQYSLRGRTMFVEFITKNNEANIKDVHSKETFKVPVSALRYNPSTTNKTRASVYKSLEA